jgi:hypothetical protein
MIVQCKTIDLAENTITFENGSSALMVSALSSAVSSAFTQKEELPTNNAFTAT